MKKLKPRKTSRILEIAADERYDKASQSVAHSTSVVHHAKKLVERSQEIMKGTGLVHQGVRNEHTTQSPIERARELVKQSKALIEESLKRRA